MRNFQSRKTVGKHSGTIACTVPTVTAHWVICGSRHVRRPESMTCIRGYIPYRLNRIEVVVPTYL